MPSVDSFQIDFRMTLTLDSMALFCRASKLLVFTLYTLLYKAKLRSTLTTLQCVISLEINPKG